MQIQCFEVHTAPTFNPLHSGAMPTGSANAYSLIMSWQTPQQFELICCGLWNTSIQQAYRLELNLQSMGSDTPYKTRPSKWWYCDLLFQYVLASPGSTDRSVWPKVCMQFQGARAWHLTAWLIYIISAWFRIQQLSMHTMRYWGLAIRQWHQIQVSWIGLLLSHLSHLNHSCKPCAENVHFGITFVTLCLWVFGFAANRLPCGVDFGLAVLQIYDCVVM